MIKISHYTSKSGINFHLLKAEGRKDTGEITLTISAMNPTKQDIRVSYSNYPEVIDEQGYSYTYKEMGDCIHGNVPLSSGVTMYPDTPVEMVLRFFSNHEPQYIKTLFLDSHFFNQYDFRFTNIPIDWK